MASLLVLVLGVCWLAFTGRQIQVATQNRPGPGGFVLSVFALPSLFTGIYNGYVAMKMFRGSYQVQGQLLFASVGSRYFERDLI